MKKAAMILAGAAIAAAAFAEEAPVEAAVAEETTVQAAAAEATTAECLVKTVRSGEYEFVFDGSAAPELFDWLSGRVAPLIEEWYPKMVEKFSSEGWTPRKKILFRFNRRMGEVPAWAIGSTIEFSDKWIAQNPDDTGCALHEVFHIVQCYTGKGVPYWVQEGLADYVRFYMCEKSPEECEYDVLKGSCRYKSAYRVSANFLDFVERAVPGIVVKLNAAVRRGEYDESAFWKENTGKTVLEWENAWKGRRGAAEAPALRVLNYNVRYSLGDNTHPVRNWKCRRKDFCHNIERENPDIITFQEVLPDQRAFLERRFQDYSFVGDGRSADRMNGEASPVAWRKSRFEVVKKGNFWLSETPDVPGSKSWNAAFPRICSYAVLEDKATGRRFCVANTHTDHKSEEAREKGMLCIIERMEEFGGGAPIIFTGDHNCLEFEKPALAVSKILKDSLYLSETPPEGPWRSCNHWAWREKEVTIAQALAKPVQERSARGDDTEHIDYIYVSPGTRVLDYRVLATPRPGMKEYPSDHFPVVTTVILP